MSTPVDIRVGSKYVGQIALDGTQVRGEGGPHDARLVLPLSATMNPRPQKQAIALLEVTCSLHLTQSAFDSDQIGPTVVKNLGREQMLVRSFPTAPSTQGFEVRIPLQQAIVAKLEHHRHATSEATFVGYLRVLPTVAWLYDIGNSVRGDGTPDGSMGEVERELSMYARFAQFWTTSIEPLQMVVPASVWVERVLPGLGLDQLRLLEIALPARNGLFPNEVVTQFDAARRDYDLGSYRECIEKCRYVRDALVDHLGTTRDRQLGDVVVERLGLPADAPQRSFLNHLWLSWWDITNASHHALTPQGFRAADAHTCLMTAALILDYLGRL